MLKHLLALIIVLYVICFKAQKVESLKNYSKILTYKEYLFQATKTNLLLAAEKYKVSEAEAKIALAKIFPEPQFALGNASGDITGQKLQQQFFAGVSQTIPRGGKYRQNIKIAKTEKELEQALYEDYLRVFKLDVTKRFINVIIAQMDYEKNKNTNELLQDELKKKITSGEIKGVELFRIQIETGQIQDQLFQSEAELDEALYELYIPLSNYDKDSSISVKGSLDIPFRKFNIDSILPLALEDRTDIILAKKRYELSEEHKILAKANRRKDLTYTLGDNRYTKATNYIAPTPAYHAITAMLSFPIAWSNLRREDLKIAEFQREEAENERNYILNLIEIEINQSYDRYIIANKQLQIYGNGLIEASDKVLEQELENYKSGRSSFLDLSESHRKLDEVYRSYFRSLKTYIYSLIELEDDMGIWDLEFK
jgi:cobalt-zinc-cadmium efflux system outer membrane protein